MSYGAPGACAVCHVADIQRSIAFYQQLGFSVANAHPEDSKTPSWVWLNAGKANVMLSAASAPIVASEQAIVFYLYAMPSTLAV